MTTTTLAQALSASGQSITLADAGDLVQGDLLALDAEFCRILKVLTPTQALVQRGVNGTPSSAHAAGVTVSISVPEDFLTGPQLYPAFGIEADILTGLGPSAAATFQANAGGAPVGATYLTLSTNVTLTHERVLTAGTNISFVDAGAGSTLTINATGGGGLTFPDLAAPPSNTALGSSGAPYSLLDAKAATILNDFSDPGNWAYGALFNAVSYTTTADAQFQLVTVVDPTADLVSDVNSHTVWLELNGSHNYHGGSAFNVTVDVNSTGTLTGVFGLNNAVNVNTNATITGAGVFGGVIGALGGPQMYDGVTTTISGVRGWVGMYGGTASGNVSAFYAARPAASGGVFGAKSIAYYNENMTGAAGTGKDFAWYSEGGTNHLETGKADAVGFELERFTAQSAALLRVLDSDGTTVLSTPIAANGLDMVMGGTVTATDFIVSGSRFKSDTVDTHTGGLAVYDVNAAAYRDFLVWTNANAPAVVMSIPTTGTLSIDASTLTLNSVAVATQTYVNAQGFVTASGAAAFTNKTGAISQWTNDSGYAPLVSPTFTGVPAAPTPTVGDNTTKVATTAYVLAAVAAGTTGVTSITGTANQITASAATGAITLSIPTSPALTTPAITTSATITNTNIGAVSTDGLVLVNAQPALTGAQQWSPRLRLSGQGFKSNSVTASQAVDWILETQPVQGATVATGNLVVSSQVAGAGYTAQLTVSSAGQVLVQSGSASVPGLGGIAFANYGVWFSSGITHITANGTDVAAFQANSAVTYLRRIDLGAQGGNGIATLTTDAVEVFVQRNGTTAQKSRLYNTFTTVTTAGEWFKHDWITTANQLRFGTVMGTVSGTARVASWDYGGLEASPTAAITVPITSGQITFGGGLILPAANITLDTTTGTKLGDGTTQKLGFWNATPIIQPAGAGQAAYTDSTGGVAAASLVDVTTAAVSDPVKVNANFATIAVLALAMRTAMVNAGIMKGAA